MKSTWSAGVLMIAMGGLGVSGFGGRHAIGWVPYAIAALLIVGGGLMFLKKPFAFWVAIGASLLLTASGLLAFHHPELALPAPPILSIVIGLYLCLRAAMAYTSIGSRRPAPRPTDGG